MPVHCVTRFNKNLLAFSAMNTAMNIDQAIPVAAACSNPCVALGCHEQVHQNCDSDVDVPEELDIWLVMAVHHAGYVGV